jgi:dihydrofolate reductase
MPTQELSGRIRKPAGSLRQPLVRRPGRVASAVHPGLERRDPPRDSRLFADRAGQTAADIRVDLFPGQQHTFQMAVGRSKDADEAMRRLADLARSKLGRDHEINHSRKRTTMRKLIESTLVSLDGVIEAPERWANFDAEATALSIEELGNYDAFVMGRVTYEKFYANWGHIAGNPYIDLINAMPKYVASRSLTETAWNATLLGPDPSSAIARLKDQPGKDLIKYGTSRFDDTLLRDHLIDEFRFWIMPVVAGAGQRLFENVDTSGLHLKLTHERRLENGSVILTYTSR